MLTYLQLYYSKYSPSRYVAVVPSVCPYCIPKPVMEFINQIFHFKAAEILGPCLIRVVAEQISAHQSQ